MQTSVAPRSHASRARRSDFVKRQIVRPPAQILAHLAFGKGAELTFERADIGVIDVARHDVGDDVAVTFRAAMRRPPRRPPRTRHRVPGTDERCPLPPYHGRPPHDRGSAQDRAGAIARAVSLWVSAGSGAFVPGDQSSLRGQPSASIRCSSAVRKPGSTQRLAGARIARDRSPVAQSSRLPAAMVARSNTRRCGHGASGLT